MPLRPKPGKTQLLPVPTTQELDTTSAWLTSQQIQMLWQQQEEPWLLQPSMVQDLGTLWAKAEQLQSMPSLQPTTMRCS